MADLRPGDYRRALLELTEIEHTLRTQAALARCRRGLDTLTALDEDFLEERGR